MSVALRSPSANLRVGRAGGPARRAVFRWAWRMFRREWRQQVLVLALLIVAVAATAGGAAMATNTIEFPATTVTLPGSDPQLAADVAAFRKTFGAVDVIAHQKVAIPGSVSTIDLRAQGPAGPHGRPTLRLLAGRYPTGPSEVAMTHAAATTFAVGIGGTWDEDGRALRVVGLVENPRDLSDRFALVAPGQLTPPETVTILLNDSGDRLRSFRLPSGTPISIEVVSPGAKAAAAAAVLSLSTIGLLFVGLVAVAGFTVMAQRRLRALGMLGSLGATDRHVRLVMLANGAVVGAVAAVVGTVIGLAGWIAFAPRLETIAHHRIDRLALPWWTLGATMALAIVTAVAAAWWPARAAARIPVVAALSGRPPRPRPAQRFAVLGSGLLLAGGALLALAHQTRPVLIVTGVVATTIGLLLLAPLTIAGLAALARRSPIAIRLALRDLARYQARSGAALAAVTLAVGIAATIAISAAAAQGTVVGRAGNLPANQLVVHLAANRGAPVPEQTPAQAQTLQATVGSIATSLHAPAVVALDAAINPDAPDLPGLGKGQGGKETVALVRVISTPRGEGWTFVASLYVATPSLLQHLGIQPGQIDPNADIISSRTDLAGLQLAYGPRLELHPKIQALDLPRYTSGPNTLITTTLVQRLGLQLAPNDWLVEAPGPLSGSQISAAEHSAAAAGVTVETRDTQGSLDRLRTWSVAIGLVVALGVLAMTVGLIRTETANDLRTLTATGASSTIRRALTSATAGALALLGSLLGTAGAYLALLAWNHSHLHALTAVPFVDLAAIIVGLPLAAITAGWLLAGRQPPTIARQPLE